jgi:hypothetical protein
MGGEVVLLDEQHREPTPRGIASDAGTVDAAADDEHVVSLAKRQVFRVAHQVTFSANLAGAYRIGVLVQCAFNVRRCAFDAGIDESIDRKRIARIMFDFEIYRT